MPRITLDLSDEANAVIEQLAKKRGTTKAEVLRRGLALMEVADEARRRGLKVGAAEDEQRLLQVWLNI